MTCRDVEELIEAVAAGDVPAAPEFASHVAGCRDCSAALAAADRIERALIGQAAPAAPAGFSHAVAVAIRRRRWQHEEHLDRAFNVTIGVGVLIVAIGVAGLLNVSGVAQMLVVAIDTLSEIPRQSPPWPGRYELPTAGLTAAFVATAIGVWWWAERRPDYRRR